MSNANLGWLYYKEMYREGNNDEHIRDTFKRLLQAHTKDDSLNIEKSFKLTTTYPGLIIGSGYTHGIKNEEDSKIGFYFDYTSGLPVLPGSSVKGVLRSCFGGDKNDTYTQEKRTFIQELIGDKKLDVEALKKEIFDGVDAAKNIPMSIYHRDKFFEARIVSTPGTLLQEDYLTPHKEPLENPVPIKFIKVAGGTGFEFSFDLYDGLISAQQKLELFFQLLQYSGMGAKTNVGYGQFETKELLKFHEEQKLKNDEIEKRRTEEVAAKKEQALNEQVEASMALAETLGQKVAIKISKMSDNRLIYEFLASLEIAQEDCAEILEVIAKKIGKKPAPKNKASVKWAIKIYELLGA